MPRPLRISLFAFLAFASAPAFAQPAAFDRSQAPQIQYNTGVPVTGRLQPLRGDSRLLTQTHQKLRPGHSGLNLVDSSTYQYSGSRAGDPMAVLQFDSQVQLQEDGSEQRSIQTFNADNTVSGYRIQRRNGVSGAWEDISRFEIGHRNGLRITESSTHWNDSLQRWIPGSKSVRTLNAAGQPVVFTRFFWNKERSRFDSGVQILSCYDVAGKLAQRITRYGTGRLVNSIRSSYTYNAAGATTTIWNETWNAGTAAWKKEIGYRFELNAANDRLSQTSMEPDGSNYLLKTEYTYSYDANRNVIAMTGSGDQITYTYNKQGQRTAMERRAIGQSAITESRRYYYAPEPTAISNTAGASVLNVWPVPATNSLHIDAGALRDDAFTAAISGVDGRVIRSWKRNSSTSETAVISTSELPSGSYILNIRTKAGKTFQSKFSVLK